MNVKEIQTLGDLKKFGYQSKSIKQELRANLIQKLLNKEPIFPDVIGYEDSVIPAIERAILSQHNIILLGLRGQAKTRIARLMVNLLDEYVPIVKGSLLNDDPLQPISTFAKQLIAEKGENTPIDWLHRSARYTEKLATPDVNVADLIGDIDPIKAANLRLSYSDERVIHFGLIPRSNRCLFVINELPDLQARIQVSLFNILQEKDIQIRGFKLRLPLDMQFLFTANPEDYTNRGSIVTPLKDRIESQILTHYPKSIEIAQQITQQEARLKGNQKKISCCSIAKELIEQIAFEARNSEYVDVKSGISARLTISAYENLFSAAERRMLLHGEEHTAIRIADFIGVIPAITGKVELVYEGEQEGAVSVAYHLIGKAIRTTFANHFPEPKSKKKAKAKSRYPLYEEVINWFNKGNTLELLNDAKDDEYRNMLYKLPYLSDIVSKYQSKMPKEDRAFLMEFVLHGLAEYSLVGKSPLNTGVEFSDLLNTIFDLSDLTDGDDIF